MCYALLDISQAVGYNEFTPTERSDEITRKAAQELGKKGGSVKSEAKAKAAKANASKPRGKLVTVIAYRGKDPEGKDCFGATVEKGLLNVDQQFDAVCLAAKNWEWVECETSAHTKRLIL